MTLIEILTVVMIIGILIAILLPMLQEARNWAKTTRAKGEVRELAKAWQMYWLTYTNWPWGATAFEMTPGQASVLQGHDPTYNPQLVQFMAFDPSVEDYGFRDPWDTWSPGESVPAVFQKRLYRVRLSTYDMTNEWSYSTRAFCVHKKWYDAQSQ